MKKITSFVLVFVFALSTLTACTTDKQDAIVKYANEDCAKYQAKLNEISSKMSNISTAKSAEELKSMVQNDVLPGCKEILTMVKSITSDDADVKACHQKVVDGMQKMVDGYTAMATALENNDNDAVTAANTTIQEGAKLLADYTTAYQKLCKDNDIEIKQ